MERLKTEEPETGPNKKPIWRNSLLWFCFKFKIALIYGGDGEVNEDLTIYVGVDWERERERERQLQESKKEVTSVDGNQKNANSLTWTPRRSDSWGGTWHRVLLSKSEIFISYRMESLQESVGKHVAFYYFYEIFYLFLKNAFHFEIYELKLFWENTWKYMTFYGGNKFLLCLSSYNL